MEKKISVTCECEGQVLIQEQITAVMVSSNVECGKHHPAFEDAPSVDELLAHIGKQTGISASFSIARLMRGTEYIGIDDNSVEFEVKKRDFYDFTALRMSHPTWPADEGSRG